MATAFAGIGMCSGWKTIYNGAMTAERRQLIVEEPDINSPQTEIPDFVIDTLARCLLPKIQAYFDSPEGQAEFEAWKHKQQNRDT